MPTINKRKEERYLLCEKVSHVLSDASDEVFQRLSTNISKSNICLHVYKKIDKGECITCKCDLGNSCPKATLQWITDIESGLYLAGFGCYEYQTDFAFP